ncbi:terpene synthase family protein [Streptomyces sirii]|uniref:terpene synthase family protein n=1 Tax=Streptomyces sirii TaxID=3127701 RepID=UPI003D369422
MPQDVEFALPFPTRISPDADAARARSVAWCRRRGLVTNSVDEGRVRRWDIAGLMAAWLPDASADRLDLAVDAVLVATFLDDQFDGPLAQQTQRVRAVCDAFHDVMASSGGVLDGSGPLVAAFAEVWQRLSQGATAEWIDRTARHWDWYFDAYAEEADNRARRRIPTVEEHFALRRKSGFVYAMTDLSQKAYGFELPRHAYDDPVLRHMLDITADVVDTLNDVHSVEKEESRGDLHNLVLAIERESGCGRRESIARIQRLIDDWNREFLEHERALLDGAERDGPVLRPFVDCMRSAMSGYLHWSRTCQRYSQLIPPTEPALAADLVRTRIRNR